MPRPCPLSLQALYAALDGKANVEDVNKALMEVCAELEGKAAGAELMRIMREQALVNSGFAQNLHMARWGGAGQEGPEGGEGGGYCHG